MDGRLAIRDVERGNARRTPITILGEWLREVHDQPTLLTLDAPLGWPVGMRTALCSHQAGGPMDVDPDYMFKRITDRCVKADGKNPLEVGASWIARTAHGALIILAALRAVTNQAWRVDHPGRPSGRHEPGDSAQVAFESVDRNTGNRSLSCAHSASVECEGRGVQEGHAGARRLGPEAEIACRIRLRARMSNGEERRSRRCGSLRPGRIRFPWWAMSESTRRQDGHNPSRRVDLVPEVKPR